MYADSHVIRKETCPECRKLGNDRSGDNLAVYSDGHCYCYRCGYRTGRRTFTQTSTEKKSTTSSIVLPADVTTELPFEAKDWLKQYQLTRLDTNRNHIMWSDKWSRIIFPYFNEVELLAWQGRYVGEDKSKAKWFSQGKIHEIVHPIKIVTRKAILVEDIVDTGNTVESLFQYFKETQRPKSVKLASFLLKPDVYKKEFKLDYIGKEIPNKFVLGYGLDYDELGRNLKDLYQLEEGRINE